MLLICPTITCILSYINSVDMALLDEDELNKLNIVDDQGNSSPSERCAPSQVLCEKCRGIFVTGAKIIEPDSQDQP
jgi:hypothetical protein